MIRTLLLATLVVFSRGASAQSIASQLDQYMSAREALGQFSGAVLVAKNGRVLLSKGYGYADLEKRIANTADTKFQAASITKQFTAMAILRLREAGKLSLNDPVCRFIDRCPETWKAVSIAQLIHHSSGIPDYEEALELGSPRYMAFVAHGTAEDIIDSARTKPLDFPPGSKFHYSNTGYILLAKVIERASGMSYATYLQRTIFGPLKLTHSGIFPAGRKVPGLAKGYTPSRDLPLDSIVAGVSLIQLAPSGVGNVDMTGVHGDGGLYTTVGDLYRWMTAIDDPKFLSPSLKREFLTPSLGADSTETGYAFGQIINRELGTRVRFHTGALPGFISREAFYPDSGVAVIVMANADFFRVSRIARDLAAQAMGMPYDVPRSHHWVKTLDSATIASMVGEYVLADGTVAKVSNDKSYPLLQVPGRFTAGLLAETRDLFYVPFFEGTVRFDRDASGNVTQLVMHYDGTDRPARRKVE